MNSEGHQRRRLHPRENVPVAILTNVTALRGELLKRDREYLLAKEKVKRCASAVGEGAMAVTFVHRYLANG